MKTIKKKGTVFLNLLLMLTVIMLCSIKGIAAGKDILSSAQKDQILKSFRSLESAVIELPAKESGNLSAIINSNIVLMEGTPDVSFYINRTKVKTEGEEQDGKQKYRLTPELNMEKRDIEYNRNIISKNISKLNTYLKNNNVSKVKKIIYINDFLCYITAYGRHNMTDCYEMNGPLVYGKGTCLGYSKAFKYLCMLNDIPCYIVHSRKSVHAWNVVEIGGRWYHVDVTWNDNKNSNLIDRKNVFLIGTPSLLKKYPERSDYQVYRDDGHYIKCSSDYPMTRSSTNYYIKDVIPYKPKVVKTGSTSSEKKSASEKKVATSSISKPKTLFIKNVRDGIKLNWSASKNAEGYKIYKKPGTGAWMCIGTVKGNRNYVDKTVKNKNGEKIFYGIKAYAGKKESTLKTGKTIRILSPEIKSLSRNRKNRTALVKWKKTDGASGYQICYKSGSSKKYISCSNKTLSKKITKLKKNKTYSVFVRSYKKIGKTKYYSEWSPEKKIKI